MRARADPVFRLIATPECEARITCRLALAATLHAAHPQHSLPSLLDGLTSSGSQRLRRLASSLLDRRRTRVLDPACGNGDILLGMVEVMRGVAGAESKAFGSTLLHGNDVQLAALQEAERALMGCGAHMELTRSDFLRAETGPSGAPTMTAPYDCVVGNPPYLRHAWIRDPVGQMNSARYRETIELRLESVFPGIELDGRSDLSVFFVLLGLSLLGPTGSLCFVLPSALLEARYRQVITSALRMTDRSAAFLESATSRSFPSAAVNTGILVAGPGCMFGEVGQVRRISVHQRLDQVELSSAFAPPPHSAARAAPAEDRDLPAGLAGDQLVPLRCRGQLVYPVKTGLNEFFYPTPDLIERFSIEDEYLVPAIKSPREAKRIVFDAQNASTRLFVCRETKGELSQAGKAGALAYLRWAEAQSTSQGIGWPDLPTLRGRKLWYAVGVPPTGDVLCPRFFDRRYLFVAPLGGVIADQTFYWLTLNPRSERDLALAVLNCSLTHLSLERHGRTGLGDGVRQYALCDMAELPVPDTDRVDERFLHAILDAYRSVANRDLLPVPEEYSQPDRVALDAAIGQSLRLARNAMGRARESVLRLLEQRMARARSV